MNITIIFNRKPKNTYAESMQLLVSRHSFLRTSSCIFIYSCIVPSSWDYKNRTDSEVPRIEILALFAQMWTQFSIHSKTIQYHGWKTLDALNNCIIDVSLYMIETKKNDTNKTVVVIVLLGLYSFLLWTRKICYWVVSWY